MNNALINHHSHVRKAVPKAHHRPLPISLMKKTLQTHSISPLSEKHPDLISESQTFHLLSIFQACIGLTSVSTASYFYLYALPHALPVCSGTAAPAGGRQAVSITTQTLCSGPVAAIHAGTALRPVPAYCWYLAPEASVSAA